MIIDFQLLFLWCGRMNVLRCLILIFIFLHHFCATCVELSIAKVGQANCTVLKVNDMAIMYDCGYSSGKWTERDNLCYTKKEMFDKIF